MNRIALNDGRWFDEEKAEAFSEDTRWDGRNHISKNTGSQWDHERLYRTKGGRWVLNSWSDWQGSGESYNEISDEAAARWLVINGHESHPACAAEFAALEVK